MTVQELINQLQALWFESEVRNKEPIMEIDDYGNKVWKLNGKIHRDGGPAIEYADGSKEWYLNGKYHREDGPACEYADGAKDWWFNGYL